MNFAFKVGHAIAIVRFLKYYKYFVIVMFRKVKVYQHYQSDILHTINSCICYLVKFLECIYYKIPGPLSIILVCGFKISILSYKFWKTPFCGVKKGSFTHLKYKFLRDEIHHIIMKVLKFKNCLSVVGLLLFSFRFTKKLLLSISLLGAIANDSCVNNLVKVHIRRNFKYVCVYYII